MQPSPSAGPWQPYTPLPDAADEMLAPDGLVRPHWRELTRSLTALGPDELRRRWHEARELIRTNGVTYNVHAEPHGADRPWQLDPIPLLLPAAEAATLEAGLAQRAHLLDRLLADLYGPQQTLLQGVVPPELVFGHPGYLRPCRGLTPPRARRLHLYAADLGRDIHGRLTILADRTQAPSGAGYALENRIVLARTLPDVFRDCHAQRVAVFFRDVRETLRELAPHHRDNPRIVLLTAGPGSETYFEHAYLARYLGLTLVEGGDLTVRDNHVFLKLLGGLQPVDVILRRLRDTACDPLELQRDSFLGVPGLVQVCHAGNVAVANALGSGLLETPALLPYLPAAARLLLGEELGLPTVPTWWCGDPVGLDHVLTHLPRLVIKDAISSGRPDPIFVERLGQAEREALRERIRSRPHAYVGQERLPLATAPTVDAVPGDHGGLTPRRWVLRAFLTTVGGGWSMMPGGLARFTAASDGLVTSLQRGGGSKDTWVLTSGPVSDFSLLRGSAQAVDLSRGGGDLPSRAADDLFWLGRYAERAEGAVRLLRSLFQRLTERSGLGESPEVPALLRAAGDLMQGPAGPQPVSADAPAELLSLVADVSRPGSLPTILAALSQVAATCRDRLSADMARTLQRLDPTSLPRAAVPAVPVTAHALSESLEQLNRMVLTLAAFGGLTAESMTRGHAWRFLDMGRKLERAWHTLVLLRVTLGTASSHEAPLLEALLEICDSSMTYRRRYRTSLHPAPVLDLLLADESNPRSLAFQLERLAEHVEQLPREEDHAGRTPVQRAMLRTFTALQLADVDDLGKTNGGRRSGLLQLLDGLAHELPALSDAITRHYLTHLIPARQLGG